MNLEIIYQTPKRKIHATPLVFIHDKWHGACCWDEHFLPFFAKHGFTSIALSLREHSGSDGHDKIRWHSINDYVSDVEQVIKNLKKPPVIIGHSMGGFITQKYLETHHETPAAVLLTAIPPTGLWPTTFTILWHNPITVLEVLSKLSLYKIIATKKRARWALFSKKTPDEIMEKYHQQIGEESFRAYLDELGMNLGKVKNIKSPVLVIGAEEDTIITPKMVHRTANAYGTHTEIFPDIAHDIMLESGWEVVAIRILDWIRKNAFRQSYG